MAINLTPFIAGAQQVQNQTGIPASITLAQIMLESSGKYDGGLSGLAAQGKNLFGMKGSGSAGSIALPTGEVINGNYRTVLANFKSYNNYEESMVDHAKLLSTSRYATYFSKAKSVNDYATGLQKAGYATDPSYANKLVSLISKYNLNQYDTGNIKFTPLASDASTQTQATGAPDALLPKVFFYSVRTLLLGAAFVLMIIFFLKAFPAVDEAIAAPANLLNPVTKLNTVSKFL